MSATLEAYAPSIFDIPGCHFTPTSLTIKPGMKFAAWVDLIRKLKHAAQGIQWYLGDALSYGEQEYGEKYAQALDAHESTGIPVDTIRHYQWVAEHIPVVRRRTTLSWSHHSEVAALPPTTQDEVLSEAESDDLPRHKLRKLAKRAKRRLNLVPDEVDLIHTKAVQDYLGSYIEGLEMMDAAVPGEALFLHGMIQSHIGQAQWQKDRTAESDYSAILDTFDEAYTQTDEDIFKHLTSSGHFISDPDLDDRLERMVEQKTLKRVKTGGRQETRRGDMVDLYMLPDQQTGDAATVGHSESVYDMGEKE